MKLLANTYLRMFEKARPEIMEELYKLFEADLMPDQVINLAGYLDGKSLTEDIKEITKLPNSVYELRNNEFLILEGISYDKIGSKKPRKYKYIETIRNWKHLEQFDKFQNNYY